MKFIAIIGALFIQAVVSNGCAPEILPIVAPHCGAPVPVLPPFDKKDRRGDDRCDDRDGHK